MFCTRFLYRVIENSASELSGITPNLPIAHCIDWAGKNLIEHFLVVYHGISLLPLTVFPCYLAEPLSTRDIPWL